MLWSSLKNRLNSFGVRFAYFWILFVPVVAHMLSTVNSTVEVSLGGRTFQLAISLPFSWKLFYFGALAFAAARLLYSLICPRIIRDFDTYSEYADVGKGSSFVCEAFYSLATAWTVKYILGREQEDYFFSYISTFLKRFCEPLPSNRPAESHWYDLTKRHELTDGQQADLVKFLHMVTARSPRQEFFAVKKESLPDAFWYTRNEADDSHQGTRTLCTTLYFIGVILFFIVAAQGFWFVCRMLW